MQSKLLEYFNGDELAASVWQSKYAQEGETTPEDMHRRLAKEFAKIENNYITLELDKSNLSDYGKIRENLTEDKIFEYFDKFSKIIPQGSVMANLGGKEITSLSNCFVIGTPEDSYGGILKKDEELVQLMKRRGGVGIDISSLRPSSTSVTNSAKTSTGAVSFMHRFSNSTREVAQGGRRGALMISIDINHPDVLEFIKIKRDRTSVTGANISIKLNNEFMKAVESDSDYILRFPIDSSVEDIEPNQFDYNILYNHKGSNIYFKRINAKEYWDEIITSAKDYAEPGLMFWNRMIDYSPDGVYDQFRQVTTNPCCFDESCRVDVITNSGIKDIKDITPSDLVWLENENKFVPTKGYTNYGKAEVYRVEFSNGDSFNVTNNHKFAKIKPKRIGTKVSKEYFELVELKDLKVGDEIRIQTSESLSFGNLGTYEEGVILGWLSGDGCLSYKNEGDNFPTMYLDFWEKEQDTAETVLKYIQNLGFNNTLLEFKNNGNDVKRIASSRLTRYFTEKYETNLWKFRKGFNKFLYSCSKEFIQGYLSSYFTADGTVQHVVQNLRFNISVSSIERDRLEQVSSLLLNFGIRSFIGLSKEKNSDNSSSFENSSDLYRLTITGIGNIKKFAKYIGFQNAYKQERLDSIVNGGYHLEKTTTYTKIKSIEFIGIKEVGCIEVPNYHYFTANTIISGNSEIAMQPYDACRLIAVNLFGFVKKPFTSEAYFDFDSFYKTNYEATRLSDDLVDLESLAIDRIIEKISLDPESENTKRVEKELWENVKKVALESRRTGLGLTALGDTLAALGLKYDSIIGLSITDQIMFTKMKSELDCTIDMGILRGSFVGQDSDKEFYFDGLRGKNDWYEFIANTYPEQAERMYRFGRRNLSFSTIAPTGTVSLMCQTTSGLEPLFQGFYTRRKKVNNSNDRVDFIDEVGDKWTEFGVLHPKFKDWLLLNSPVDNPESLSKEELQNYFEKSPWYGSTANDIDWIKRVEIQSILQKYISHSISSTINLPSTVTHEEVSKIYLEGWKNNLKGITVYIDGSRSGVLVNDSKPESKIPTERPDSLLCKVIRFKNDKKNWIAFTGMIDGKPYEVFTGINDIDELPIPSYIETGTVIRVKTPEGSRYDFQYDDKYGYTNTIGGLNRVFNKEYWNYARFVSALLREGTPVENIIKVIDKLEFVNKSLNSWQSGIIRALKSFVEDGTEVHGEKCPDCGEETMIYENGCKKCTSCGYSACG